MNKGNKLRLQTVSTGVPGFDVVLGGGLPEHSFNLVAGGAGSGKTTLTLQTLFANATVERPALYFTVLGEPTLKMIRYQRQFNFFKPDMVGSALQFVNLSDEVLHNNLDLVLERIQQEVERTRPGLIAVDSFRPIGRRLGEPVSPQSMELEHFIQRLAVAMTSWEVTSFLIGEYAEEEVHNPAFTVADGVFWMRQVTDRNSVVRKMQVLKVRGQEPMPGLHTFRITDAGVQVFPRIPQEQQSRPAQSFERMSTGVPGLDDMMGGGIHVGDVVMLAGPAGSGKTTFASQFVGEGLRQGEAAVIAIFEEYPEAYMGRAKSRDADLKQKLDSGKLKLLYLRPLDLSVDETLHEILEAVKENGATRVVIDSLSGFEIALAPAFRVDFRESLYRLVGALTATGVTVFTTAEITGAYPEVTFTSERVSFITDDIIVQRYVEIEGEILTVLSIMKMRGSQHSREFLLYEINKNGAVVGGPLMGYHGIMSGIPTRISAETA